MARETVLPEGVRTIENWDMTCCMANPQAVALKPSSLSNQQVIASPANPITLPLNLSTWAISASIASTGKSARA